MIPHQGRPASRYPMEAQSQHEQAPEALETRIRELGPWFHNIEIGGVMTAPDHFLGNFPAVKWERFRHAIPADLSGRTVLDIGCNGGFYSIEMKRRGADRVVAIDFDPDYLRQARFAAEASGVDIEFRQLSVYDVAALGERFDIVLFMGVLYHLRHPLLALDLIHEHVAGDLVVFQSLQRGSTEAPPLEADYPFSETAIFEERDYPKLFFVEQSYSGDNTNWWIPNRACSEAMLRSAGFSILAHPEEEVFVCRPRGAAARTRSGGLSPSVRRGTARLIEAVMIWNEPNNKSHWDPELDPDWSRFAAMVKAASEAVRAENAALPTVLGGMSPIDPSFVRNLEGKGALDLIDVVAVHGFPLDWNLWSIHDWPAKIDEIRAVTDKPVWVFGGGGFELRRAGGAELGIDPHGRVAERRRATGALVQPLRPAEDLGSHHAP